MRRESLVQLPAALTRAAPRGDARFVMGIDGGATKTLAAVLDLQEQKLAIAHGGPSNEDAVGTAAAVRALLEVADQSIARAGIDQAELGAAVLAVAGTDTEALARQVAAVRSEGWLVVNDVVAAWAAATGARPGVGVIAGTGSNVFGVGPRGAPWRAGGWGHVLGDEGSGYWLGVQSIRAALRDREGTGPPTALSEAVTEFFAAPSVERLAQRVYAKPLGKRDIAAFATETGRIAAGGDAVACELYQRGARELALQVGAVVRETGLHGAFPVGLIGSAYKAGEVFVGPLVSAVHEFAPQAQVAVVEMAPVGGSLLLAARACGRADAVDPAQLSRVIDAALHEPLPRS